LIRCDLPVCDSTVIFSLRLCFNTNTGCLLNSHVNEEATVLQYVYTPQGILYTLKTERDDIKWQVTAAMIHPINGVSMLEQYNINTGETKTL